MNKPEQALLSPRDHFWRYSLLGTILLIVPVIVILRMVLIQANPAKAQEIIDLGNAFIGEWRTVKPMRGQIYDTWGHILAANKLSYEVGVDLNEVKNPATIAETAARVLGMDYALALHVASIEPGENRVHSVLQDNVSPHLAKYLMLVKQNLWLQYRNSTDENKPSLEGLVFQEHLQRTYPENSLGSNILGFLDGEGKGNFGVEGNYNGLLAGKEQKVYYPYDPILAKDIPAVPDGVSAILTIDRAVQAAMEDMIDYGVKKYGAEAGSMIVIDPRTGGILAMASSKRLNLNEYWSYGTVFPGTETFNPLISKSYEPGSVFKVFPMATAMDLGLVKPDTVFIDRGVMEVGGYKIYNWDRGAWGEQTMLGCMQHSLNVCLAWVAKQIGPTNFYRYMEAFGIGHRTGIDMAGEGTGILLKPGDKDWYEMVLGVNAFGQGLSATPLQMASGISALANNGEIIQPHIVRATITNGKAKEIAWQVISTPIKAETAQTMSEMLAKSLEIESSNALVEGYRVAGKTGTAEIPTPYGYSDSATHASFVGWGPVDQPRFLVYIWLEKPTASIWGSETAAPLFSEVVKKLVVLLNIPPDKVRQQLLGQ